MVIVTYVAGCTHTVTGQKAFETFDQCITANLGVATAGGFAIGALGKALARQVTSDRGTQDKVAVAAGVGAAVMIGLAAWKKCAAVYNKSEPVVQASSSPPPAPAVQRRRPGIAFDKLDVRVEGTENDPPTPEFEFVFTADDPAAKDIKAQFRHKVEIVRFKADDNDNLVLADASGEAMKDPSGHPIPLANAMRMPRERLAWVTIAEDGRDDYVEDVVIQQGGRSTFRHRLQVPPRAQLPVPLPVPMRYTVTVEADKHRAVRTVDFALLPTGERPKRYSAPGTTPPAAPAPATPAPAPVPAPAATPRAEPAAPKEFEASHTVKRSVPVYDQAKAPRKSTGRLARGERVRVEEHAEVKQGSRTVDWVRIATEAGRSGWMPASELTEIK